MRHYLSVFNVLPEDSQPQRLRRRQQHCAVSAVLIYLILSLSSLLLKPLKIGDHRTQKLQYNLSADIGHYPEGKYSPLGEIAPCKHVVKPEYSGACTGKIRHESLRIDPRNYH